MRSCYQPPYHLMKAPPTTSPKKQIPSNMMMAGMAIGMMASPAACHKDTLTAGDAIGTLISSESCAGCNRLSQI